MSWSQTRVYYSHSLQCRDARCVTEWTRAFALRIDLHFHHVKHQGECYRFLVKRYRRPSTDVIVHISHTQNEQIEVLGEETSPSLDWTRDAWTVLGRLPVMNNSQTTMVPLDQWYHSTGNPFQGVSTLIFLRCFHPVSIVPHEFVLVDVTQNPGRESPAPWETLVSKIHSSAHCQSFDLQQRIPCALFLWFSSFDVRRSASKTLSSTVGWAMDFPRHDDDDKIRRIQVSESVESLLFRDDFSEEKKHVSVPLTDVVDVSFNRRSVSRRWQAIHLDHWQWKRSVAVHWYSNALGTRSDRIHSDSEDKSRERRSWNSVEHRLDELGFCRGLIGRRNSRRCRPGFVKFHGFALLFASPTLEEHSISSSSTSADVKSVDWRTGDERSSIVVHIVAQSQLSAGAKDVLRLSGTKFPLPNLVAFHTVICRQSKTSNEWAVDLLGDLMGIDGNVSQWDSPLAMIGSITRLSRPIPLSIRSFSPTSIDHCRRIPRQSLEIVLQSRSGSLVFSIALSILRSEEIPLGEPLDMAFPTARCQSGTVVGHLIKGNSKKFSVAMTPPTDEVRSVEFSRDIESIWSMVVRNTSVQDCRSIWISRQKFKVTSTSAAYLKRRRELSRNAPRHWFSCNKWNNWSFQRSPWRCRSWQKLHRPSGKSISSSIPMSCQTRVDPRSQSIGWESNDNYRRIVRSVGSCLSHAQWILPSIQSMICRANDRLFSGRRCQWTATTPELSSIVRMRCSWPIRRSVHLLAAETEKCGIARQLSPALVENEDGSEETWAWEAAWMDNEGSGVASSHNDHHHHHHSTSSSSAAAAACRKANLSSSMSTRQTSVLFFLVVPQKARQKIKSVAIFKKGWHRWIWATQQTEGYQRVRRFESFEQNEYGIV